MSNAVNWAKAGRSPERLRELLLQACAAQYAAVSKRPDRSSRRIARGILDAERVIAAAPVNEEATRYLGELRTALLAEKERLRADVEDEDGWGLGGVTTILNAVEAARAATPTLEIRFEPRLGKKVARRVALSFFGWREFPQAFARMIFTREFWLLAGFPALVLLAAKIAEANWLTALAVLWLLVSLGRLATFGYATGVGCVALGTDGGERLVGGLRLRVERKARRIWIAGIYVDADFRGAGIATALILGAFRLAQLEAARGPVMLSVFAPAHPASKAIVARQFRGLQDVSLTEPLSPESGQVLESLKNGASRFSWQLSPVRFFDR